MRVDRVVIGVRQPPTENRPALTWTYDAWRRQWDFEGELRPRDFALLRAIEDAVQEWNLQEREW